LASIEGFIDGVAAGARHGAAPGADRQDLLVRQQAVDQARDLHLLGARALQERGRAAAGTSRAIRN
jgi:hypothetical protein